MSKANTHKEVQPEQPPMPVSDFAKAPEMGNEYQDLASEQAEGWYQSQPGSWMRVKLLSRVYMRSKDRYFYQAKVIDASANMIVGKGDEAQQVPVTKGAIIAFDERKALEVLAPYAESDGVFEAFIHCVSKDEIDGGKTFYRFTVKVRTIKKPSHPIVARKDDDGRDDIPF